VIFEEKLIFFPQKYPEGFWNPNVPEGYSLKDIFFTSGELKLHAWLIEPKERKFDFSVLLCHGNAGNITTRLPKALAIASCGVPVFMFDYRGYGKSEDGDICENAVYEDSTAAYNWMLENGFREESLVIHGISLGGGAACYLAEKFNPLALSLESTFTSIPDMCRVVYPWIPKFLVGTKFNNLERISSLNLPIQVFHGTEDDLIPIKMGQEVFKKANDPKWFITIEGAGHGDLLEKAGDLYEQSFQTFFSHLSQQS